MNYAACTTTVRDRIVKVNEKRSSFELENKKRAKIDKILVDGCLITGHVTRCDWILHVRDQPEIAYFVELKGCDLKRAVNQLSETLKHTRAQFADVERRCFAVTTKVPKAGTSIQKLCREFFRQNSAPLKVVNIKAKEVVA